MPRQADGGASPRAPAAYRNPLRDVQGLKAARVDMGTDWFGRGVIYPLGPAVITKAATGPGSPWYGAVGAPSPGTWIAYKLTAGPLAGQQVYVAEDVQPLVREGQRVDAGTPIARFVQGSGPATWAIETGFAAPGRAGAQGETAAAAAHQQATGSDPGARPTAYGEAFSQVLRKTGAPPGPVPPGSGVSGGIPGWLQRAIGIVSPAVGLAQGAAGAAGVVTGVSDWLHQLDTAITWLLNPGNWIRIFSGITGGIMVVGGIFVLSGLQARTTQSVPVVGSAASSVQSSVRLPVGIFMVGAGGVLLFVAFHNLPGDVVDLTSLLAYEKQQLQASSSGGKVAA